MKLSFLMFFMSFSFLLNAQILNSNLETRHQELIEKIVMESCNASIVVAWESSTVAVEDRVDQGVIDKNFYSKFIVYVNNDFNKKYEIEINSIYSDQYDHGSKNWGVYSITSVSECISI